MSNKIKQDCTTMEMMYNMTMGMTNLISSVNVKYNNATYYMYRPTTIIIYVVDLCFCSCLLLAYPTVSFSFMPQFPRNKVNERGPS